MRAQRSQLDRASMGAQEIAPEADLSQMMIRRRKSGASADRLATLEVVHSASGPPEASPSDGLFFKKGCASAEGFRPSYWVYERRTEDAPPLIDPVAPRPQPASGDGTIPLSPGASLAPLDDAQFSENQAGIAAAADVDAPPHPLVGIAQDIEPEADLSTIVIRRTRYVPDAEREPTVDLADDGAGFGATAPPFDFAANSATAEAPEAERFARTDYADLAAAVSQPAIDPPPASFFDECTVEASIAEPPAPPAAPIEAYFEPVEPAGDQRIDDQAAQGDASVVAASAEASPIEPVAVAAAPLGALPAPDRDHTEASEETTAETDAAWLSLDQAEIALPAEATAETQPTPEREAPPVPSCATGTVEPSFPLAAPSIERPQTPSAEPTARPAKPDRGAGGSIVAELTEVIESVLSSKSYSTQQNPGTSRVPEGRSGNRRRSRGPARASARHLPAAAPSPVAGGRSTQTARGFARVWRIVRVAVLAIIVGLLWESLFLSWFMSGQPVAPYLKPFVILPIAAGSDAQEIGAAPAPSATHGPARARKPPHSERHAAGPQ